ncbi:hypothetical protein CGZ98_06060 [Enemella evansiae]|uniref:hypothetical protein n=1 Tax=Enemella evansiae TaxID=2016499 RepID=UPI000B966A5D|nr:hypothetical protein [Enemella evansiae]OYO13106.1 hypothetical protein CGZ98_06060 [Enemella evansiae]
MTLLELIPLLPLDIPDITPTEPPGLGGLITILNWIAWGVSAICLAAFLVGVAVLVFGEHSPESRGGKKIILSLIGVVLVGSATTIFAVFTN